jgi:hypothetical protein
LVGHFYIHNGENSVFVVRPADLFNTLLEDPEGFLACHPWIPKRMADKILRMAARDNRRRA